jgi:hypothetical protein
MQEKVCSKCKLSKPLTNYYIYKSGPRTRKPYSRCKECLNKASSIRSKTNWIKLHGSDLASKNKSCSKYLGIIIAETILAHEFPGFTRMPNDNPGYDYDCPKGFKIDVKSACTGISPYGVAKWQFEIRKNKVPHFFIFVAFDNRTDLNLLHIWLIPGPLINTKTGIVISNTPEGLAKWSKYSRPLTNALNCCSQLRGLTSP